MPKIALVCDWLTNVGGAERVLLTLHKMYPDAPIYTSQYNKKGIDWFLDADVRTGWMQAFPSGLRRFLAPFRQIYFSHLDLTDYDIVISVTGAEAKFVKTKPNKSQKTEHQTVHLCYCHVPTQYYWQMYDDYIKNPGFGILNPLARLGLKLLIKPLRKNDFEAAKRPDQFITISSYAAEQIKKYYKRESKIIFPPVDIEKFSTEFSTSKNIKKGKSQTPKNNKNVKSQINHFITTSRQVTWKRLDLCIKACLETGDELTLIGDGPEHQNLVKLANNSPLIKFLPVMNQADLAKHLAAASAYLFPSKEPFGIAPVEALSAGCPVIAFKEGGATDYIIPDKNGIFFDEQTSDSLAKAIKKFNQTDFDKYVVKTTTSKFAKSEFVKKIKEVVDEQTK